jgi:tetratricopeptide (TPR) repeat protein
MRCFSFFAFLVLFAALGFTDSVAQSPATRDITGQVRVGGQPAPAGVPVVLQIVSSRYATSSGGAEVARTVTDKKGAFSFDHLEALGHNGGREFFAVSAQSPDYGRAFQVADLTFATHGKVTLVLDKEKAEASAQDAAPGEEGGIGTPTVPARPPVSAEAREALSRAQDSLFRRHDPAAASEDLKKLVRSDPWYGPGYILLGLAYMQMQRWTDAQDTFTEAIKVEPGNIQAHLGLGSALNEQHKYAEAQKALDHSLELDPNSAEAHYELARTFAAQEKWDEAAPHALRSIEINPDYAGPHALMGNIYLMQQDLPFALAEFRQYLQLDPQGSLAPSVKELIADIQKQIAQAPGKRP